MLFKGSIRNNLDPMCVHNDGEILTVLQKVQMLSRVEDFVARLSGSGLGSGLGKSVDRTHSNAHTGDTVLHEDTRDCILDVEIVEDRGSNFSLGQRQLLCLGRAMLRCVCWVYVYNCVCMFGCSMY